MDATFDQALATMHSAFDRLEKQVPPPQQVWLHNTFFMRYVEQTLHQALIQKLARVVSGLHALLILHRNGFVQEQGAIQRTIDEFNEDILFLAAGNQERELPDLHRNYLAAFYKEEFDVPGDALASSQKRWSAPRDKIRAYVTRALGAGQDASTIVDVGRTISKAYSGYVHGASPHIMEMYGGDPPRFHLAGLLGTPRMEGHAEDVWDYFYRSLCSFAVAAKAFGDAPLLSALTEYIDGFETSSGANY
jgi:hypothetical protein